MAAPARDLTPYKRKLIQLIHVAKSRLGLDDATYRAILERKTGKSSSTAMSMSELEAVLEHMRSLGFEDRSSGGPKPASKAKAAKLADDPQSKLIRHLWLRLRDLGAIQDSSEAALASFVKGQTKTSTRPGVERLEWLDGYQASMLIERMKKWIVRVESATPEGS